jgi:hypothetical protein
MPSAVCILLAALLAASIPSHLPAHEGAKGVVKERMDAMEAMAKAIKSIAQKVKANACRVDQY